MLKENINKISAFVTIFLLAAGLAGGCRHASSNAVDTNKNNDSGAEISPHYAAPQIIGRIESAEINESSGLIDSRCQPGVLWTHNDSGDDAFIFALDRAGKKLGTFRVANAKNRDWEDLGTFKNRAGECFLYAADIGDNERSREELTVYKFKEPSVSESDSDSGKKNATATESAQAIKFRYPDGRHDAETIIIRPQTEDIYVLTKNLGAAAGVYKLPANYDPDKTNRLEKVADFTVPAIPNGLLTGGAVSPDGARVVVCDYFAAYEIELPKDAKKFDEIWKQKPRRINLGAREIGEAVAYAADGESIFATSENRNSPLIEVKRK